MASPPMDPNTYAQSLGILSSQIVQLIPPGISESREELFDKVDGSILIALNLIEILQTAIHAQEEILSLDPQAPGYTASLAGLISNSPSRELLSQHIDVAFSNAIKLRDIMEQLLEEKETQAEIPPSVGRTIKESKNVKRQRQELEKRLAEYLSEEKPVPKLTQTEMELARASQQEIKDLLRARVDKLNKLIKKAMGLVKILQAIDKKQMEHFGAQDEKDLKYILEHGGKPVVAVSEPSSQSTLQPTAELSNQEFHAVLNSTEGLQRMPKTSILNSSNPARIGPKGHASFANEVVEKPEGEIGNSKPTHTYVGKPLSAAQIAKALVQQEEEYFDSFSRRMSRKAVKSNSNPFTVANPHRSRNPSTPKPSDSRLQRKAVPVYDPQSQYPNSSPEKMHDANPQPTGRNSTKNEIVGRYNATIMDDIKDSLEYDHHLSTFAQILTGELDFTEAPGHTFLIALTVFLGLGLGIVIYKGFAKGSSKADNSSLVRQLDLSARRNLSAEIQKCILPGPGSRINRK